VTFRSRSPLPIDDFLPEIARTVQAARAAVVVAAPGAGKTTRVPPALADADGGGPVIVLQPRRIAARAIAQRIASERGWTLGAEVGWHVRFERRFSDRTRVLLATEGILTARLLADPLLSGFNTIVLDEFHERSVHADLGIALAKQAWLARDDLRIVVMSATMDARPVAAYLGACPIVEVPDREHRVEIGYAPRQPLAEAVREVMAATRGNVLCFLAGAPEIRRAMPLVEAAVSRLGGGSSGSASGGSGGGVEVVALHGSLDAAEQDRAIRSNHDGGGARRIILATNIAETSLTVPDVHAVIDTGLHKVARYDPSRGIDSLDLERISADSADQRAGRAGRLGPGVARRLWDARDRLQPHREPDIARIDLAAPLLDLIAWGGDPETFEWFEAPPAAPVEAALMLLDRLGAIETATVPASAPATTTGAATAAADAEGAASVANMRPTLTPLGRTLQRLPLHPRLGRILLSANGSREAARACALLAERHFLPPRHEATTCDLLAAIDRWQDVPPHVQRVARELEDLVSREATHADAGAHEDARTDAPARGTAPASRPTPRREPQDVALRRAIFDGYADRVGRRRAPGSPRVLLASGHGAVLAAESGVRDGEFLVALDAQAQDSEALIRIASQVDRAWLQPTHITIGHWFDREAAGGGRVRAARREHYGEITLTEHPIDPDPAIAAHLLAEAYLARPLPDAARQLLHRLAFAGHRIDAAALLDRMSGTSMAPSTSAHANANARADASDAAARLDRAASSSTSAKANESPGAGARAGAGAGRGSSSTSRSASTLTLDQIDLAAYLLPDERRDLERLAPERLPVPSGRAAPLTYHDDGTVSAAVKLQELFGLADTPRLGRERQPVLLHLLAPNGRPVQMTRDLRSFWTRTYPEVRKELRGRYPKHPWPEDPWSAEPTARTTRRPAK
jgi:ATP-dependent helicase HrpB